MRSAAAIVTAMCMLITASMANGQRDSQPPFEPRSSPGEGQKFLNRFVGEWSVTKTFYPRASPPNRTEGRCRQDMIHEGRFLQSEFVFQQGEKKTTGLGIIGFEPETGRFTSFWTDSRQTRMSVRQSHDKFDGKEIVLYSRSLETEGKEARRSRTVSRLEEQDRKLVHRQYALGPAGEERLVMELVMTRLAGAHPANK